jgi:hypothetical protein
VNNDGSDPNNSSITPDFEFSPALAIINLDATGLHAGPLGVWTNSGALPGNFGAGGQTPSVATQQLVKGVSLDGINDYFTGPVTPVFMTGTNSRTVEAWIYNPMAAPEENIFAWGRRGGNPDGSNCSFNHGTDPTFGAVGHWGAGPDIGWNGNITTGRWTFVAYTYDKASQTVRVYRDGQQANSEVVTNINTFATNSIPPSPGVQFAPPNGLPFRVGAQNEANGSVTPNLRGSMTIARLRVYDEALSPDTGADSIQAHYLSEVAAFNPPRAIIRVSEVEICWDTISNLTYQLQYRSSLTTDAWTTLGTNCYLGDGGARCIHETVPMGERRFYRIVATNCVPNL